MSMPNGNEPFLRARGVGFVKRQGRLYLELTLEDGSIHAAPLSRYPTLQRSRSKRDNWRLIGRGTGIHWPDLDYHLSVAGIVSGLRERAKGVNVPPARPPNWKPGRRVPAGFRLVLFDRWGRPYQVTTGQRSNRNRQSVPEDGK